MTAKRGPANTYEVIVGNVGTIHTGHRFVDADMQYRAWIRASKGADGSGRAVGEPVTLMRNGEVYREYEPSQGRPGQPRRVYRTEAGGRGISVYVTGLNRFTVQIVHETARENLTFEQAGEELGHAIMQCLADGGRLDLRKPADPRD